MEAATVNQPTLEAWQNVDHSQTFALHTVYPHSSETQSLTFTARKSPSSGSISYLFWVFLVGCWRVAVMGRQKGWWWLESLPTTKQPVSIFMTLHHRWEGRGCTEMKRHTAGSSHWRKQTAFQPLSGDWIWTLTFNSAVWIDLECVAAAWPMRGNDP